MTRTILPAMLALSGLLGLASQANAAQIVLTEGAVVGDSGGFDSRFQASNILDRQTGIIEEQFANGEYWLNSDGRKPAFITIDLGAAYQIGSFDLFNSLNLRDRGTAGFEIYGANTAVAASGIGVTGLTLGSDALLLASGTLVFDNNWRDLAAQSFASLNTSQSFRYLQFRPTSPMTPSYGGAAYGLNELRVFEYGGSTPAVPEPTSWAMMICGFGLAGGVLRSRRSCLGLT